MIPAATNVVAFRPRRPAPEAPLSDSALVSKLLELAREFDRSGRAHVAYLLVGAAYAMCDDVPPDDGGRRRSA